MILITGANGFVGHKLMELCKDTAASPSLRNVTQEMVNRMIEESNADVVVHTAAISDIGTCEADPEASYFANVQIPMYLANACKDSNRKLICFSSDQVYSACEDCGPYTEENVKPGNIYAAHKLEMEKLEAEHRYSLELASANAQNEMTKQLMGSFVGNMLAAPQMQDFLMNAITDSFKKGEQD